MCKCYILVSSSIPFFFVYVFICGGVRYICWLFEGRFFASLYLWVHINDGHYSQLAFILLEEKALSMYREAFCALLCDILYGVQSWLFHWINYTPRGKLCLMSGAHPVFMGPDSYTISGAFFFLRIGLQNWVRKWIFIRSEKKKPQQITNLKKLTNTTNVKKSKINNCLTTAYNT
jgi:hypothetical protein